MANSRNGSGHQRRCTPRRRFRLDIGELESRCVPSVYTVTTTANSGAGSFRQAILDANGNAGLDTIRFSINTGKALTVRRHSYRQWVEPSKISIRRIKL